MSILVLVVASAAAEAQTPDSPKGPITFRFSYETECNPPARRPIWGQKCSTVQIVSRWWLGTSRSRVH